jgi:hypothetical protein
MSLFRLHSVHSLIKRTALLVLLLTVNGTAIAAEPNPWWITVGGFSQHFSKQDELNQSHPGIGAEYSFAPHWAAVAGTFKNSTYEWSQYAGVNWLPFEHAMFKLGASAQITNHYHKLNDGGIVPIIVPMMSMEYGRFGANLYVIPTLRNVTGSVAIQFKIHL